MKNKETIEEAAERLSELQEATYTIQHKTTYTHGFVDGAKWQQQNSYSEKELLEILASYAEWSTNGDCTYYDWLEQHKKK